MNLENTSTILKKINRLHELITTIGEANSTEYDLLKAYVVDLYGAIAMSDIEIPKDYDNDELRKKLKKQKKAEKKLARSYEKKMRPVEDDDDDEEIIVRKSSKKAAEPKARYIENGHAEEAVQVETVIAAPPAPIISDELKELFDLSENLELSDKLANTPIKDLSKAMGINEKVFTVQELFGGNQNEMDTILLALNGLTSFEEAKSVLMRSVAIKYKWTEGSRNKKAKNFIRLVNRRFNT